MKNLVRRGLFDQIKRAVSREKDIYVGGKDDGHWSDYYSLLRSLFAGG